MTDAAAHIEAVKRDGYTIVENAIAPELVAPKLAPKIVTQVMDLILRLRDETGLTVVLVEQNARSALAIADRGMVLNVGRVVAAENAALLAADEALRKHYLGF